MSEPVEVVPIRLHRFTAAARIVANERAADRPTLSGTIHWTPSPHIGRVPCIGLDSGHIPGTRPDRIRWGAAPTP